MKWLFMQTLRGTKKSTFVLKFPCLSEGLFLSAYMDPLPAHLSPENELG